jgi:hypothetical protein
VTKKKYVYSLSVKHIVPIPYHLGQNNQYLAFRSMMKNSEVSMTLIKYSEIIHHCTIKEKLRTEL